MTSLPGRLLLLAACYVTITLGGMRAAHQYAALWLPLLAVEVDALLPRDVVRRRIDLEQQRGQRLFVLHVETTAPVNVGAVTLPAGFAVSGATLQAYALHHVAIVVCVLVAWPVRTHRQRWRLLCLAVPCIAASTSLDLPFVLTGVIRDALLAEFAPGLREADLPALYFSFLHRGGRTGLALAIAAGAAVLATGTPRTTGSGTRTTGPA
jgi:hypothetical protein